MLLKIGKKIKSESIKGHFQLFREKNEKTTHVVWEAENKKKESIQNC